MPGRPQHHLVQLERRTHQGHPRQLALRDALPLRVDHHPGAVEIEPGGRQHRLAQLDAGAGLDGIDEQARDAGFEGGGIGWHGGKRTQPRDCARAAAGLHPAA
jgi:hypothetical protein